MALATSENSKTLIMGVVNITPDSFSDGGRCLSPDDAITQIDRLIADGADIVDLGAESTRPGAQGVDLEDEWMRLAPVLEILKYKPRKAWISVDTQKSEIMRRLLNYPVDIINDVRGGVADDQTLQLLAGKGCTYLAMHMYRPLEPTHPQHLDGEEALVALDSFYRLSYQRLVDLGFDGHRIWLDPGIGFGKTDRANLLLIRQALQKASELSIVLGISRKSFIGRLLDIPVPLDRDDASKMLELSFLFAGVRAIRTHDVRRLKYIRDFL